MELERRLTCQEEMEQVRGDKAQDQARGEAEAREAAGEAVDLPPDRAETVCVPAADTKRSISWERPATNNNVPNAAQP